MNSLVSEIRHIVKSGHHLGRELRPLAELVAGIKARPGQVSVASYSPGTMSHVLGLLFNQALGTELQHVGYRGSTPTLADVMGNPVPLMFDGVATSLPLIRAGKLKALAVSTSRRMAVLPEVPTFTELGLPCLQAVGWMGLWCTPHLPAAAQARLRAATLKVLAQPGLHERLLALGFEAGTSRTPEDMSADLRADSERVGAVLKSVGFKPD